MLQSIRHTFRIVCATLALTTAGLLIIGCQSQGGTSTWAEAEGAGWHHYGHSVEADAAPVSYGSLRGGEYHVVLRGTIEDVCAVKGCWMNVIDDSGEKFFVRFQDYSFFVPRNAAGHHLVLHGTAVNQVTSVEEMRHYAEDAGKSAAEIAAITEPVERVVFFADAVLIEGDGLDEPHQQ